MKEKKFFLTQDGGEEILKIIHKHPITLLKEIFISIIIFIVSMLVMMGYFRYNIWYVFVLAFALFIFSVITGLYSFLVWDRDIYIITDKRLVDIEQKSLFAKSQKETTYDKVQDTNIEVKGIFGAAFRFGDLLIQTASDSSLRFADIYNPASVQKIIMELAKNAKSEEDQGSDTSGQDMMETLKDMIKTAIREEKEEKK